MVEILIALELGNSELMFPWHLPFSLLEQMCCDMKRISICFQMLYIQECLCNTGVAGIATTGSWSRIESTQQPMTVFQGSSTWQRGFGQPLTAAVAPLTPNGSFTGRLSKGLLLLLGIRERQPCLKCSEPATVQNFFLKVWSLPVYFRAHT